MFALEGIKLKKKSDKKDKKSDNKKNKKSNKNKKSDNKKINKYDDGLIEISRKIKKMQGRYILNKITKDVVRKWLKQYYDNIAQYYENENIYIVRFYLEIRYLLHKFVGYFDVNFNVIANRELYQNIININFDNQLKWFSPSKSPFHYSLRYGRTAFLYINIIPYIESSSNFEEYITSNIYLASKTLVKGGYMILQLSNIFTPKNYYILGMLTHVFKEVHVIKPQADPLSNTNMEYYIIGSHYRKDIEVIEDKISKKELTKMKSTYKVSPECIKKLYKLYKDMYKNYKQLLLLLSSNTNIDEILFKKLTTYLKFYRTYLNGI